MRLNARFLNFTINEEFLGFIVNCSNSILRHDNMWRPIWIKNVFCGAIRGQGNSFFSIVLTKQLLTLRRMLRSKKKNIIKLMRTSTFHAACHHYIIHAVHIDGDIHTIADSFFVIRCRGSGSWHPKPTWCQHHATNIHS